MQHNFTKQKSLIIFLKGGLILSINIVSVMYIYIFQYLSGSVVMSIKTINIILGESKP